MSNWTPPPLNEGPQDVLTLVHRTTMHRKLKHFGSTLYPPPLTLPAGSPWEEPCAKEHEVVGQLLAEDDLGIYEAHL